MSEKFSGKAPGYGGEIVAEIEVDNGVLKSVHLDGRWESPGFGDLALEKLEPIFLETADPDVDVVSGATVSSTGAKFAFRHALENAGLIEPLPEQTIEMETDVLIVGCGSSGVTAALAAAERGARVIMMDRTTIFGGNGLYAHGGYFVGSYLQKRAGETFTCKEAYDEAMYFENYLCDPILMRDVMFESGETVRWCNSHGAGLFLLDYYKSSAQDGLPHTYHGWGDNDTFGNFKRELEHFGNVEFVMGTKCVELIQNENGEILGAVGEKIDGSKVRVKAGAVYIGTGGYIGNRRMIADAVGEEVAHYLVADTPEVSDGTGIQLAWKAGAAKRGHKLLGTHGARTGFGHPRDGLLGVDLLTYIPILWVNRDGRRFMNEDIIPNALLFSNTILAQGGFSYIVFDQASLDEWKVKKIPLKMAFWDRFSDDYYCPPVTTFEEDFQIAVRGGGGFKADTIAELAEMFGADAKTLEKTVNAYNIAVETKTDNEFFKSAESLLFPVKTGPFYAIRCCLQAQGTSGGVAVNRRMQAIDDSGRAIPNLYIGGSDAGGLYAASYTNQAGMAISWALTSGRLAGIAMAEQLGFDKVVKTSLYPDPEEV